MKTPLCTEVDLGPGHNIVLDGIQAPPVKRAQQPPSFRPMSIVWPQTPISATAKLLVKKIEGKTLDFFVHFTQKMAKFALNT